MDLVPSTEEILNEKLHFLCTDYDLCHAGHAFSQTFRFALKKRFEFSCEKTQGLAYKDGLFGDKLERELLGFQD